MENLERIENRLSNIETLLIGGKTVLNFDDLAAYCGLSKSYLYKLTSTGQIPHYKPNGKHIFFNKIEIDEWLQRNRVKTAVEIEAAASTHVTLSKGSKK